MVAGISCINPRAPFGDFAVGLNDRAHERDAHGAGARVLLDEIVIPVRLGIAGRPRRADVLGARYRVRLEGRLERRALSVRHDQAAGRRIGPGIDLGACRRADPEQKPSRKANTDEHLVVGQQFIVSADGPCGSMRKSVEGESRVVGSDTRLTP
jgi:hypothetical protein